MSAMKEFIEVIKTDNDKAYDFIANNYYRMDKSELTDIIKELLYAIDNHLFSSQLDDIFEDVADELTDIYEDYEDEEDGYGD